MAQPNGVWPVNNNSDTAMLHQILAGLQSLQHQNARLSASVDMIYQRVDAIDGRIAALDGRVDAVSTSIRRIEDRAANTPAPALIEPTTNTNTNSHNLVDYETGILPNTNPTPQSSPSSPHERVGDLVPPPEETYVSFEAMERAMHAHTRNHGFDLVRASASKNKQGVIYKRMYSCSQHGRPPSRVSEADRIRKGRVSRARGCEMRLTARSLDIDNVNGPWQIRHRISEHSHEALPALMHPGHRRRALTNDVRDAIRMAASTGQPPREILENLQVAKGPDALYTRTDLYNEIQRQRLMNEKAQNQGMQDAQDMDGLAMEGD